MPTPAHTDFDSNNPQGSQSPSSYATSDLNNLRALRDMIIGGEVPGFVQSRTNGTGTANQPQFITWLNATLLIGFRWNITWTGFNPTTVTEEWSSDNGATWTAVSAQVNTFDASQNITASTVSGGWVTAFFEVWAKCLNVISGLATHLANVGTAVHGLGTVSTQNANAVAFTGGSTDGVTHGATTPETTDMTRARETIHDYGAIAAAGTVTPESNLYAYVKFTPSATTTDTITIANPSSAPAAGRTQTFTLEIVNGQRSADGKITWGAGYHWIGGAPARPPDNTLELAGSNLFACTWNGATWDIVHMGKRG